MTVRWFVEARSLGTHPYFKQVSPSPDAIEISVKDVEPPWIRSCMNPTNGFDSQQDAEKTVNEMRLLSYGLANGLQYRIVELCRE
jgi:hypothetical protein